MTARRGSDEMAAWLQRLRDYVRDSSFALERELACQEYMGATGRVDEAETLERRIADSGWFLFDRCHSRLDCTPLRLFVDSQPDLPERIRENLLACERSVGSVFSVVATPEPGVAVLQDLGGEPGDCFRVQLTEDQHWVTEGEMVSARLSRWDSDYLLLGPVERWPNSPRDLLPARRVHSSERLVAVPAHRADREGARYATRTAWLRERRSHP